MANPYGSYVSAPQPAYQDLAPAPGRAVLRRRLRRGQQADGSWYGGAANGYLPAAGYPGGDHPAAITAANGHAANGHGYDASGYLPGRLPERLRSSVTARATRPARQRRPVTDRRASSPGQYDQRGYGTPDLAYGQDGYQGYPGYGAGGR